jgi:Thioesterase-like superfamily
MMTEAFWIPEGNQLFRATIHTQGPWNPQFQHGGPPAALLVRQLEACSPREDMVLARVSIDILAPVPIATLTAHARVLRPGRSVELLEASLEHEGRLVMRATAWRVRLPNVRPPADEPHLPPGLPEGRATPTIASFVHSGFFSATEWRTVRENNERGQATAWVRLRYPLIAGETISPIQHLIAVAD